MRCSNTDITGTGIFGRIAVISKYEILIISQNEFIHGKTGIDNAFISVVMIQNFTVYVYYDRGSMRMDSLSYQYYNDPNYGWLILQANPRLGMYEFNIEDKSQIRIPYPLESAIRSYEEGIDTYDKLYGLDN